MKKKSYNKLNVVLVRNLKKKIEEFKKEKKLSETIIKTLPYGLDIVDEKGNILYMSDLFKKIFGESSLGKKCWKIYKDNKKQCHDCPLKKKIKIGETKKIVSEGVAGGRTFSIWHTGMVFDNKNAFLEIFHDVTEQEKHEEELKKADIYLNAMGDALIVLDKDLNVIKLNKVALKMLGYEQKDLHRLTLKKIMSKKELKKIYVGIKLLIKTKKIQALKTAFMTKKGKETRGILSGTVMLDNNSKLTGFVGVFRENKERKIKIN